MTMTKTILLAISVALLFATIFVVVAYRADIRRAHSRVQLNGTVIASPYGEIEYTERGSGPAVLVIHGSGGGYDQGEIIADTLLGPDFRSVTPSRFGYLRSTFRDDATWEDQAHAFAYLLDHLGIGRAAVVAMSHGGPSALLFAVLYPERVSSLTLVSCGVAASASPEQAQANRKGAILTSFFKYDFSYWSISKLARRQLMRLMGVSDSVIVSLTPAQTSAIERIIDYMNPASLRSAGVSFDNRAALPGARIAAITAPTLIIHAVDDSLHLYHNAEFAASTIPNSRLLSFDYGGHVVMLVEQAAVRATAREHIVECA